MTEVTGGVAYRVIGGFWDVSPDGTWVVGESYDVLYEDVEGLLHVTKPPKAIEWVIYQMQDPIGGGADRKRAR